MDFPGHFRHIFQQLNHQRLHSQLCDCVVLVGGQSFRAHRSILAACSSHFRALVSSSDGSDEAGGGPSVGSDMGEVCGGPTVMELDPEVVTPEAFSTLLDMIYTSALSLGASNVMDVLLAASHLHLNSVVKACKLHLSRMNFPASPPKGWRSVQQQQLQQQQHPCSQANMSELLQHAMEEDDDVEEVGVEVSQSGGGVEGQDVSAAPFLGQKRKSHHKDNLGSKKRSCWSPKECSPTVTRSSNLDAGEELLSPDCLKSTDRFWRGQGTEKEEEEVEEKYKAFEEIQLPSQSDSCTAGIALNGDTVVKVKVGEEGEEEEERKMTMVEVKKENLSSYSPGLDTAPHTSSDQLEAQLNEKKMVCVTESVVNSLQSQQLCTDLQAGGQGGESGDLDEECVDGEGLDTLSELAFSCFLNPSSESVMGALGEEDGEDSLASLTAAVTAAATTATASDTPVAAGEQCQNSGETINPSSDPFSSSSSSLIFPVNSVPLQQLLPTQSSGFGDTLILQPTQNSTFLNSICLETPLVQQSKAGKTSGASAFRRIAPKVQHGLDAAAMDGSPLVDRPLLTRASEEVQSKCKKAAAEDHVLLVEGEKKYACKICCKTFMNLTDCKKHIRVHTGEKPYPCPKCGKRFSQSSHLYKHSKNTCLNWKEDQTFSDTLL